ncbi:uncharacterized protein LOC126823834 [Patella vulgata]|uniref:uncharacterized protein LOC126823834 n=1 Tax=Patella vulgata TaxID=6465 RepID=UPI0021801A11|nr:uncharacterized protein LOC126823834 [Patella vulgata]
MNILANIFVMATVAVVCDSLDPPVYLWPLSDETLAYEVVKQTDAVFPKINQTFKVGPGHPSLLYDAMYFDRGTYSYAEVVVPMTTGPDTILHPGFSVLFNPEDSNGVILHYKSDTTPLAHLTEFYIILEDGHLKTFIDTPSAGAITMPASGKGPYSIPLQQWTHVTLVNLYNPGETRLYINGFMEKIDHSFSYNLCTPGKLRFGSALPSNPLPSPAFKGFMTCGCLFNQNANDFDLANVMPHCRKTNWPNSSPSLPASIWFTETTTKAVSTQQTEDYPVTLHLWPMDSTTSGYDVITMANPKNIICPRFGRKHPTLPHASVHLDGSVLSVFEMTVKYNDLRGRFTFACYIFPEDISTGSVFYARFDGPYDILFDLRNRGDDILFTAYDKPGHFCAVLDVYNVLTMGEWQLLAIEKDNITNNWIVWVNNTSYFAKNYCGEYTTLNADVFISIGPVISEVVGFYGDMRCLVLLNDIFGDGVKIGEKVEQVCLRNTVAGPPVSCPPNNARDRTHIATRKGLKHTEAVQPMTFFSTKSAISCCTGCSNLFHCRSFTWDKNGLCVLYDFVAVKKMVPSVGTKYFVIKGAK